MINKVLLTSFILLLCCSISHAAPVNIWATGQTASYRTGDDGELQLGVAWPIPRFTPSVNCVTDNLTGLMWSQNTNLAGGDMNWQSALNYANNLSLCGYSDWRLPNRKELQSLIDYSNLYPSLPTGHPFTNVQLYYYWSSTSYANYAYNAWFVDMRYGNVFYGGKAFSRYVWPVRSGQVGSLDYFCDSDDDGHYSEIFQTCIGITCVPSDCQLTPGDDCDDNDDTIYTGASEFCDNKDNDCDGSVDEDYIITATNCGVGACLVEGQLECQSGVEVDTCNPNPPTGNDSDCNSIDDNCDGLPDNLYVAPDTICGVGECARQGKDECENGEIVDTCIAGIPGVEGPPGDQTCSGGLDEDCDGATDNNDEDCIISSSHQYDDNQDWIIGDFELLTAIDDWASGLLGDFELLNLIDFWAVGCYQWDAVAGSYKAGC